MLKSVLRGLAAAALAILPLTVSTPAHAAETVPLSEAIARLPMAVESRDGYDRDAFKHWNAGANPSDGCNTRAEVLKIRHLEDAGHGAGVSRCSCTRAGRGRLSELKIVCRFGDRSSSNSTACKGGRPYALRAGGASGAPGCGTGRS
ncbi:hypothetical protein [Streptomyces sp. I5]|uniref:hypothetical protein n=1 Tax=Streptomyces sp. I5 TaxID=2759947 RepID=UPI0035A8B68D